MAATKINLTKLACIINDNAVRGCSYENFLTRKFIIRKFLTRKFPDLQYYKKVHSMPGTGLHIRTGQALLHQSLGIGSQSFLCA